MPDSEKTLDFTIRTKAELAGAEQFAASLDAQIGKSKALGQDYSALAAQRDKVNESIKNSQVAEDALTAAEKKRDLAKIIQHQAQLTSELEKYKEAIKDQAAAHADEMADTTRLELGKRELLESMRGLTSQFPLLGEAARAIFNPITAVFGATTIMVGSIFEAMKRTEDLRLPDLTEGIDQADKLGTVWSGIGPAVAEADMAFASVDAVHARALASLNAELTATLNLIQADKARALAALDVQRAGGMNQGEYARKKAIIERGADAATAQAEIDARNKKLAADMAAVDQAVAEANRKIAAANNFKGPATKEDSEAKAAALKVLEDQQRAKESAAQKRVEQIQDKVTNEASAKTWGDFVLAAFQQAMETVRATRSENSSGLKSFTKSGQLENEAAEKKAAAEAREKADATAAEIARINKAAAEKERLQKEADEAAKKAREMQDKIAPELAPNAATTPGTVAYENAQQAARQKDADRAARTTADA